jgi:hypothetical protein
MTDTGPARDNEHGPGPIGGREDSSVLPDRHRTSQRPGIKTDRQSPRATPHLGESVTVAQFWRNRRGEAVRVSFEPYKGRAVFHVRQYFTDKSGKLMPTRKGVALGVARLPELAAAVSKALAKAHELGLLEIGGAA